MFYRPTRPKITRREYPARSADFMGEEVIPVMYRAVDELRERGGLAVWIVTPTY